MHMLTTVDHIIKKTPKSIQDDIMTIKPLQFTSTHKTSIQDNKAIAYV